MRACVVFDGTPFAFLGRGEFWMGAAATLPLGGLAAWLGHACRRHLESPAEIAGFVFVGGSLLGLGLSRTLPLELAGAVLALLAAGLVRDLQEVPWWSLAVLVLPGGLWIAVLGAAPTGDWLGWLLFVGTSAAGVSTSWFDVAHHRCGGGSVLLAITVVGVYFCVPDTEQALLLLGVAPFVAVLGARSLSSLGSSGAVGSIGLIAWVIGTGGAGRPGSVVGGLACFGLLVAEPTVRLLTGAATSLDRLAQRLRVRPMILRIGLHTAVVSVASRVVGAPESAAVAGGAGLLLFAATAAVLVPWSARGE